MTFDPFLTLLNLAALGITITGGLVRGYTGFGSGMVMIPLMALMWGPIEAIITTVTLGALAVVQLTPKALPLSNWRDTGPMVATAILLTPIGTYMLVSFDAEIIKNIIAVSVLATSAVSLAGWEYRGPRGMLPSFIAGGLASVVNGVAGVGGPPSVLYLVSLPDPPEVQRANIVIIMAAMGLSVLGYTLLSGSVGERPFVNVVMLAVPYMLAVWAGAYLFKVLPGKAFKIIVLWLLVALSVAILVA